MSNPGWAGSFDVDGVDGGPIELRQIDRETFLLGSKIVYTGETGLESKALSPDVLDDIKVLDPAAAPDGRYTTDLASVPGVLRWFVGTYGDHTPAVLIHDRLIPTPDGLAGMTEAYADRYLRFMLGAVGMRWLKRWIVWAGVALRTRWAAKGWRRTSVVLWVLAALTGITTFVVALSAGSIFWAIVSGAAPLPFALLWGKQYGAGIIASIAAPWLLPPTIIALIGYLVYLAIDSGLGLFLERERRGTGPYRPAAL